MKLWIALCVWVLLSPVFAFWVARFFYVSNPQSRDDLSDADRIWREDTAFNAINSGAPFPPRTGPGAGVRPHCARSGNVLNSNFHASTPNRKGHQDNA